MNEILEYVNKKSDYVSVNRDKIIEFINEKRDDLNSISANIDNILDLINSISSSDKFIFFTNFLESMKKNLQQINTGSTDNSDSKNDNQSTSVNSSTANIRGKKMFKLAKAYTRYYIKNMLPNMLRCAGNDPKATSNVIKVSTDEIQDLMYGDTINHPENLAEVNNPAVRDQIASDVEQAVKGDQISGGAADGLSIEDIAKKWSEIYKQVPYEYLLNDNSPAIEALCVHLNLRHKFYPFRYEICLDIKTDNVGQLKTIIQTSHVFSTNDFEINSPIHKFLQELYPEKSKYENETNNNSQTIPEAGSERNSSI